MSFSPKACTHCAGTSFHVLPDVMLEAYKAVSVLGVSGGQKIGGWMRMTLVVCAQCTRSETFMTNVAEIAPRVPGAYHATATR